MAVFDHLAVAAQDLAAGAAALEALLGVPLEPGGRHATMGTHNRLLSLGPGEYLELIAIDPAAPDPGRRRWFALDDFSGRTRPRAWIARCDDLDAALALAPEGSGVPTAFERDGLRWRKGVPADGWLPLGGLSPSLIEWGAGVPHPAQRLPDRGVRLRTLRLIHPDPQALGAALAPLIADPRLRPVAGPAPAIEAVFDTPSGRKELT